MALFTVLLDYRGGTYVSQVNARSPRLALRHWAVSLDARPIARFGEKGKATLLRRLARDAQYGFDQPTQLEGCPNVWCASAMPGGLVNIVKTVKRRPSN